MHSRHIIFHISCSRITSPSSSRINSFEFLFVQTTAEFRTTLSKIRIELQQCKTDRRDHLTWFCEFSFPLDQPHTFPPSDDLPWTWLSISSNLIPHEVCCSYLFCNLSHVISQDPPGSIAFCFYSLIYFITKQYHPISFTFFIPIK